MRDKAAACKKHFVGDGGTINDINENNTVANGHEIYNIHMPAYYNSIIKGVSTVMASYSSLNGVKMHVNRAMLTDFFKEALHFRGFVFSDWEGIDRITPTPHSNYTYSIQESINGGVDMVMGQARKQRLISGALTDQEVRFALIEELKMLST
ncbi:hypothetical protein IFM89_037351 [Coptis chinensis]|uniref:Glycoside hydrolase family 3 N-terminal domain-containing protein n=1 Tax=Coptis chinensis TaxID=261450 RepID=A0A835II72_9MAGN|nr:hypothetical protein IFM89_037351 [Coptis chinensis]